MTQAEDVVVPSNSSAVINWAEKSYLRWLTLFITGSTLLCCALPVLLVSLGFGALVANLNYNVPGLMFLAEHKVWTLILSGLLLAFLAWIIWRPEQNCPTDPHLALLCKKANQWNRRIFWMCLLIWSIGFFFSFLLLPLRLWLDI